MIGVLGPALGSDSSLNFRMIGYVVEVRSVARNVRFIDIKLFHYLLASNFRYE